MITNIYTNNVTNRVNIKIILSVGPGACPTARRGFPTRKETLYFGEKCRKTPFIGVPQKSVDFLG